MPTVLLLYSACVIRMLFAFETPLTMPVRIPDKTGDLLHTLLANDVTAGRLSTDSVWLCGAIWLIGALITLAKFIVEQISSSRKLMAYCECKDSQVLDALQIVQEEAVRNMPVKIYICSDIDIPMGVGLIHRRIFLPEHNYSDKDLYYVLKHEYTHFCNYDLLIKYLIRVFCCVFWWNPVVYLLKRDLAQVLEIKCDRVATENFTKAQKAEYLYTMVKLMACDGNDGSSGMKVDSAQLFSKKGKNAKKHMVERFDLIIRPIKKNAKLYQVIFLSTSLLVFIASYSFVVQPAYEPPVDEIVTSDNTWEVDTSDAYILKHKDGRYTIVLPDGSEHVIKESTATIYLETNKIEIREE